ncbi:dolichyldiphosphatase 1-like [Schistocerca gregaria]|uniref:dolichyldiphosphatase 1-like n=1 Tax=Schistocerca gregaria TaxID=7010 RepID=UPI00211EBC2D|nr:dolichyldiphosphatase 1-like [Schistocerca gregaria]
MEQTLQNNVGFLKGLGVEEAGVGYEIMQNYILVSAFFPYIIFAALTIKLLMGCKLRHIWIILGLLLNEGLNYVLKNSIMQPRPPNSFKQGYGMPSDHTQFMGFFLVQALWENYTFKKQNLFIQASRFFVILLMSVVVGYGRIVMNLHTTQQIICRLRRRYNNEHFWVWAICKTFPMVEF